MKKLLLFLIVLVFIFAGFSHARPKYYISIGYGSWSLNIIKDLVEDSIGSVLEDELKDSIQNDFPEEVPLKYSQDVNFDSSGGGVNFHLRIYPGGENGSFSVGIGYFRVDSKINLSGEAEQVFVSGNYISADAQGEMVQNYSAFTFDLKWDLLPDSKIHPYISIGGGIAPLKGEMKYSAFGQNHYNGNVDEYIVEEEVKTLEEVIEDSADISLTYIPVILLNFGVKADIIEGASLFADFGIWNGFMLKGGIAYSF